MPLLLRSPLVRKPDHHDESYQGEYHILAWDYRARLTAGVRAGLGLVSSVGDSYGFISIVCRPGARLSNCLPRVRVILQQESRLLRYNLWQCMNKSNDPMAILLEVCVDSIESALAAKQGGADRLEVCSSLAVEGTTPSYGFVKQCVENAQLPVMMMIRPHDGGFVYSDVDIELMLSDIEIGHALGVHGFVFGALTEKRKVHIEQCRRLLAATGARETTFHRAFDIVPDPMEACDQLIDLGFDRLLTSGQKTKAQQGVPLIRQLHERAKNRIIILPGAGVNSENAQGIIDATGVNELHTAAAVEGGCGQSGKQVSFGTHRRVACAESVREIRRSLTQ